MNDDLSAAAKPIDSNDKIAHGNLIEGVHDVEKHSSRRTSSEPPSSSEGTCNGGIVSRNGDSNIDKSDSEAETLVLSGKEEDPEHTKTQAIKLEGVSEAGRDALAKSENHQEVVKRSDRRGKESGGQGSSLKRKRLMQEPGASQMPDGGNSSNLSSNISSPVHETHSPKIINSDSDRSRSSPPFDDVAQQLEGQIRKRRKRRNDPSSHHQLGKSDRRSEPANGRERRETRSATHYDGAVHRSESPPSRMSKRAQSMQSSSSLSRSVTKRRKTPAALHVERQRKGSEELHPESDGSSSVQSHHRLRKVPYMENNAMSPAKISHKKNRDRNGRTLLARACATDVVEAEKWLKERPQDIDVPDNAGNAPLQIAALEGDVEVVQLLLDHGCDIHCMNIDKDTPLIDAVENGHLEVVRMLLKAGLDPRQKNAKGQEPLELIPAEDEEFEEIQAALMTSKREKEMLRRPSEDYHRQSSSGTRDEVSTINTSGTSPTNSTWSPPPGGTGPRRRTARSQPTNDSLLWVNATPERLRDAAGKGDLTIVDHILKMRPKADTESVLAAARGGHDVVLGLLLAIAAPDPDPEPLQSGEYKAAYSTPMLAAIGRGNTKVISLLLDQPGFDPTRRMYKGLTYFEIAKERQNSEGPEEYEILKSAYENHKHGGRRSNNNSPRKVRSKRADTGKPSSESSSSTRRSRKARMSSHQAKEESADESWQVSSRPPLKRKDSVGASDQDSDFLSIPGSKAKGGNVDSDLGSDASKRADVSKPKRRLMSGNDFKTDQNTKWRASLAVGASSNRDAVTRRSGDSASGHDSAQRRLSDGSEPNVKSKKASSEEPTRLTGDLGKKRPRMSVSPRSSRDDLGGATDIALKKKKQRIDSRGTAIEQDREHQFRPGPAMVANMIASPTTTVSPTVSQGTAPVAFMGSNMASPVTTSPKDPHVQSAMISPVNSIDQAIQPRMDHDFAQTQKKLEEDTLRQEDSIRERERQTIQEEEDRLARIEAEKRQYAEAEREKKVQEEKEEAEVKARIAHEPEEARLEAQRQAEGAERQLQIEQDEEEARAAKRKREEDMQQRRLEQERIRREEQERKRREAEERESINRMRLQEEAEMRRRQALPNGLRRAAELSTEEARDSREITKWLPLRTVTTQELDPGCEAQIAEEQWIANIQAAPVLAIQDMELSQCE